MSNKSLYISNFRLCDWDHFLIVKGIAILMVVIAEFLDHFYGITNLEFLGELASAVFLICSGYGLSESYRAKNGMPHYWENKVIKLWIPSLVVLVALSFLQGGNGVSWIGQYPTALYGWFMYILFGEYAAFWLVFRLIESRRIRVLGLFMLSLVAFFFLQDVRMIRLVFCFPVGVWFSQYRLKYTIREFGWGKKLILTVALIVVAVPCWMFMNQISQPQLQSAVKALAYITTAGTIILGTYFIRVIRIWGIFAPCGMMSYALYLLDSSVFKMIGLESQWRYMLMAVVVLLVVSAVYSWLVDMFVSWNKYNRRKKQTHLKGSMW